MALVPADESAAPLVAQVAERYPLVDLSVAEPSIEDVIARIYASSVPSSSPVSEAVARE